MKARIKKIKRLDDRNLRAISIVTTSRATDSLASAMKNLELDKRDMAMVHLLDVFDYLMETKNATNEIWKRYRKKKKEARGKALKLKELRKNRQNWTYLDLSFDTDNAPTNWWETISDTSGLIDVKNPQSLESSTKRDEE